MFDWKKFLILASILLAIGGEEYIRLAISREYYGLFGVLRRYLINVKNKYYLKSKKGDVHGKVFDELRNSNDATEKEVSKILNKLRVARNQADYDDDFDIFHFLKFLRDNEKDLERALDTIDYFENHPNYWGGFYE